MSLKLVPFEEITKVWFDVEQYISRGCEHTDGKMNACDVLVDCLSNKMQLWVVYNKRNKISGAMATQIVDYHRSRRVIICGLGADDFKDVADGWEQVKSWARANHADNVEIIGRKGWIRVLDKLGFEPKHILMSAKLWKNSTRT